MRRAFVEPSPRSVDSPYGLFDGWVVRPVRHVVAEAVAELTTAGLRVFEERLVM